MSAASPEKPHTSTMTFWALNDPIRLPQINTDHWAKRRAAATQHQGVQTISPLPMSAGKGGVSFDKLVATWVFRKGSGTESSSQSRARSRERRSNSFNERAKEGFQYWHKERPKPTSFGRYGFGSYKTVLGLGNGPRT